MRTVPSRRENKNIPPVLSKKKSTVPSRCGRNCVPSRPVVKNYMHRSVPSSKNEYAVPSRRDNFIYRPVPSWQFLLTAPSRRDTFYLPSCPVMKQKGHCTVPSRPVEKIHTHRPVPSHPGNYNFRYFTVPSSTFFPPNMSKKNPSSPVSNITSHEKPFLKQSEIFNFAKERFRRIQQRHGAKSLKKAQIYGIFLRV